MICASHLLQCITSHYKLLLISSQGLSKHFKFGEVQHEAVGTPYTVAPEVIRGSYDERCDVWAIGELLLAVTFGLIVENGDICDVYFNILIHIHLLSRCYHLPTIEWRISLWWMWWSRTTNASTR